MKVIKVGLYSKKMEGNLFCFFRLFNYALASAEGTQQGLRSQQNYAHL